MKSLYFVINDFQSEGKPLENEGNLSFYQWSQNIRLPLKNDFDFYVVIEPDQLHTLEWTIPLKEILANPSPRKKRNSSFRKIPSKELVFLNNNNNDGRPYRQIMQNWKSSNSTLTITYETDNTHVIFKQVTLMLESRRFIRKSKRQMHKIACLFEFSDGEKRYLGRAQQITTVAQQKGYRMYVWKGSTGKLPFSKVEVKDCDVLPEHLREHTEGLKKLKVSLTKCADFRLLISPRDDDNKEQPCDNDSYSNSMHVLPVILSPNCKWLEVRIYNMRTSNIRWTEIKVDKAQFTPDHKFITINVNEDENVTLTFYYDLDDKDEYITITMLKLEVRNFKTSLNFLQDIKNLSL